MKIIAAHASRPKVGESVNGDGVVTRLSGPRHLIAVVDALGHGPVAAEVSKRACDYLETVALTLDLKTIVNGLHAQLRNTRGAAAMVCTVEDRVLEGCGVGNVELRVHGSPVPVVLSPGVLGGAVRMLRVFRGELHFHSRMVLFSDGISSRFSLDHLRPLTPADASHRLLALHSHAHDDATALVADIES